MLLMGNRSYQESSWKPGKRKLQLCPLIWSNALGFPPDSWLVQGLTLDKPQKLFPLPTSWRGFRHCFMGTRRKRASSINWEPPATTSLLVYSVNLYRKHSKSQRLHPPYHKACAEWRKLYANHYGLGILPLLDPLQLAGRRKEAKEANGHEKGF